MQGIKTNTRERYRAIDPYIKQSPLQDVSITNFRQYDDSSHEDIEVKSRINEFEYSQYNKPKIRVKRQTEDLAPPIVTPLYFITAFFATMFIFGPFLVKKGPNRGLIQCCIMLSAFCMWIFWFTIYFGQMNPLMGPRLENTTVAWIAYKLGNPFNTT